ncbi:MAG: helix-turn-helix domain-containing protein [Alphaproteobacteria bacterium]|nr:helix-turn-helix domain-containing protein [Alphaproteobacteria bacterium]
MKERLLTRTEASEYLASVGTPVAVRTLAKLACVGGGPAYRKFNGHAVRYSRADLDAWIAEKLSPARENSSQHSAAAIR